MARATTTAQDTALAASDRRTFARISVEDPDGTLVDMSTVGGVDFFDGATIEADADAPISLATFSFWRAAGDLSLSPLMEGSTLNRDSEDAYAPLLNPARQITVEVATMLPGETPDSGDWVLLWDGLIDEVDWASQRVQVHARDRMAQLNDTIIETVTEYGADDGSVNIDTVMQAILDDVFGSSVWTMTVVGTPTLPIAAYDLGHVTVLDALKALADLIGWSLHYRWDASASAFRLTFYEPDRDNTTASYTFSADDYYSVSRAAIGVQGIRNKGEVVYTDVDGEQQTVSDTRSTSVAIYGTRFIRIDAQNGSITTSTQANALLAAVLDDLESPKALQEIEAAFHWPVELGDVHTYSANGVHYDTAQSWACFGYRHVIEPNQIRTVIQAAGKPSGGFRRWHQLERRTSADTDTGEIDGSRLTPGTVGPKQLQVGNLDNLIVNPGFEADASDMSPWREVAGPQGTWTVSTTDPRSGLRCLRHDPSGMTGVARVENGTAGARWEAAEGDQFFFSTRYQTNGVGTGNDVEVRIIFRDSSGTEVNNASTVGTSNSTSYQDLSITATAGAGTTQVSFELRVQNDGQAGIRTFDDCYARRIVDANLVVGTLKADVIVASESFTAANPVFEGVAEFESGEGATRVEIDSESAGGGLVRLYDASSAIAAQLYVIGNDATLEAVDVLTLRSVSGSGVVMTGGPTQMPALHVGAGASGSPPSGYGRLYYDSANKVLRVIHPDGTTDEVAFV